MSFANIVRRAARSYASGAHRSNRPVRRRPVKRSHSQKMQLAERALREVKRRI